jgi:hypothetical protein
MASDIGPDDQDLSEIFDEDNQDVDGSGDMRTPEEQADVLDVTRAAGDDDDDDALIAEELDDDDIIALEVDGDATDIEDDDLAGRTPEAFDDDSLEEGDIGEVIYPGEAGLEDRSAENMDLSDLAAAEDAAPRQDAPIELTGDVDAPEGQAGRVPSRMEAARELSDEDLEELGYRDDKGVA